MRLTARRRRRLWQAYTVLTTAVALVAVTAAFGPGRTRFEEIDVERINIVEADGQLRLVISNRARSPDVLEHGEPLGFHGGNRPGMIFYNDEGSENGGLVFSGKLVDGVPEAFASLTFDQYGRDQAVALQYVDAGGTRRAGLAISDFVPGPPMRQLLAERDSIEQLVDDSVRNEALRVWRARVRSTLRLYVGRSRDDGAALVSLHDFAGRQRLRMTVDSTGAARIEFLDENRNVVRSIGPED
jgi:hypothetical protein